MSNVAVHTTPLWLRGGSAPRHTAAAVILGTVAGAVAGWNLSFALLVGLALAVNGPALTTLAAGLLGFAAAHVGANLTTAIGSFLLEKVGLAALVESLGHAPSVALFGLHDYATLGGGALAVVLSLPAAHALSRRCRTTTAEEDDDATVVHETMFRPWGLTSVVLWIAAVAAVLHVAAPQQVGRALLAQLSAAAQAPVTADHIQYDVFTGVLHLSGLRVRDLDEPGRIALRVDDVRAAVDPGLLLRGRLHADEITFAGLTYDAVSRGRSPRKLFPDEQPTALRETNPAEGATADPMQPIDATAFVRNWNDATARLAALGRVITLIESIGDAESSHAAVAQRLAAVRRPAAEPRDPITGRSLPLVQIKAWHIEGLPAAWSLGEGAKALLTGVTSRPSISPRGVQLTLEAPACESQLTVQFRLTATERRHELEFQCGSCAAADLIDLRYATVMGLESAAAPTLAVRCRGTAGRDRFEAALVCDVVGFRPAADAPRFGNLDAAVWRAGIDRLGGVRIDATLAGRWNEPRLQVTPAAAVDQLKHQLRSVGEHLLVKAVEAGRFPSSPVSEPSAVAAATKPETSATLKSDAVAQADEPTKSATDPKTDSAKTVDAAKLAAGTKPVDAKAVAVKQDATKPTESATAATAKTAAPALPVPQPIAAATGTDAAAAPSPASGPTTETPSLSAVPASTKPTGSAVPIAATVPNTAPAATLTTAAASIAELRQPAGVLDPSARPGLKNFKTGQAELTVPPAVRPRNDVRPSPAAAPQLGTAAPYANSPSLGGAAVVVQDAPPPRTDAKSQQTSLMTRWFDAPPSTTSTDVPTPPAPPANLVRTQPRPAESNVRPQSPLSTGPQPSAVPQPTVVPEATAASKPLFPRIRKLFGTEDETTLPAEELAASPPVVEREQTPSAGDPSRPFPQTAKQPWYERMFR